ncbi:MAG: hypothetical protein WBC95_10810 [Albidovulum sp.]
MAVRIFVKRLICMLPLILINLEAAMADSSLIRGFEIPDPARPIAEVDRGLGPSGELIPFEPSRLQASQIVGRRVDEIVPYVGTYGMGGPGFFGIRLGNEWLTIAIWGASEWITVDGLLVQDMRFGRYNRPEPWISENGDRLSAALVGSTITAIEIRPRALLMSFSNGLSMSIDESPDNRPIFEGTKQPRRFVDGDDLRDVVFLSPTTEIWVD